ncbi:hypothetical protein Hanom_Chr04g00362551 [Helianthus anomalus]
MKILMKFPPYGKRLCGKDGNRFLSVPLLAQFDLLYPLALPRNVQKHVPDEDIPDLPRSCGPLGAPQFPQHVVFGPALGATLYQQLQHDVDILTHTVGTIHMRCSGWLRRRMSVDSMRGYLPDRTILLQEGISRMYSHRRACCSCLCI